MLELAAEGNGTPLPVLRKIHGRRRLAGCSPVVTESDTTE